MGGVPPSLGGSPIRPASLSGGLALPPVGLQEQHWLAGMGSQQQQHHHHQQQQQQRRASGGKGEGPAGSALAAAPLLAARPLGMTGLGLPPEPGSAAAHRRMQQLAEGMGAVLDAAAHAAGGGGGGHARRLSGMGQSALDAAQQLDGFGRYRTGSLHNLQQLGPELAVEGLQGLTPTASARADPLLGEPRVGSSPWVWVGGGVLSCGGLICGRGWALVGARMCVPACAQRRPLQVRCSMRASFQASSGPWGPRSTPYTHPCRFVCA